MQDWYNFVTEIGDSFLDAYVPIVERRKDLDYTEAQRNWQEIRRGRYVEFNLVHDKGTLFGLKTNGTDREYSHESTTTCTMGLRPSSRSR